MRILTDSVSVMSSGNVSPPRSETLCIYFYLFSQHMLFPLLFFKKTNNIVHTLSNIRVIISTYYHHFLYLLIFISGLCSCCRQSRSKPNLFFYPKEYKLHFWLEETPTQLLYRLTDYQRPHKKLIYILYISVAFSHPFLFTWLPICIKLCLMHGPGNILWRFDFRDIERLKIF